MWGSSFLLTKVAVAAIAPTDLVAGRFILASATLVIVLLATRRRLPRSARLWLFFLAMALMGNCIPFWLITWGQQKIGQRAGRHPHGDHAAYDGDAGPLLRRRRAPQRFKAAGFLLGFVGIVVLMGPRSCSNSRAAARSCLSQLAVLGGAVCYAVNTIIARHRPESDALVAATGVALVACAITTPAAALTGLPDPGEIPAVAAAALAVLGIVSTATATVVYFKLIALAGPSFLAFINYLIPGLGRSRTACCSSAKGRTGRRWRDWPSFCRGSHSPKPKDAAAAIEGACDPIVDA